MKKGVINEKNDCHSTKIIFKFNQSEINDPNSLINPLFYLFTLDKKETILYTFIQNLKLYNGYRLKNYIGRKIDMNKKLILASMLCLGMLVGCGGGEGTS